ncbi:tetratricopeptide repeat protein [Microbulbifer echini]|uniref:Tetratricopeptide repeat protein n=1 Tax=Microbulbifer echini TaxID=1529067 RepID=A0ABV4NLH7_9GAMM
MKKLLLIPIALLFSACTSQTVIETSTDPLSTLTAQVAQIPNSVLYETYWRHYLESPQSLKTLEAQQRYQGEMAAIESGQKTCTEVNWQEITQLNSISLLPHLSATECYESTGNNTQANHHQNIFNFIATGVLSTRRGDAFYSAYEIASWGDAEDLLGLSGYEVIDSYFEFAASRNGLYKIYNVRDPENSKVRKIYFDNTRFLHRLLEIKYPFAGLSDALYKKIIQPMAETDYAARHAIGQVQEAEGQFLQAEQSYLEAIGMGSISASISLGNLCLAGKSTKFTLNECAQLFVAAADQGLQEAKVILAYITQIGLGIETDTPLAKQLLASAAQAMNSGEAEYIMALLLSSFQYSESREEQVQHYLQASANHDYAPALFELAGFHLQGPSAQQDAFKRLLRRAAEQNFPPAQFYYGKYLLEVADENLSEEGMYYLQQAAEAGFPMALHLRGKIAENGLYQQRQDSQSALRDFEAAALRWHLPAQFRMGTLNTTGKILPTNHELAYGWYALCAKVNHLDCITSLGYASAKGAGVEQDYQRALKIYQYAAQQGSARASFNLGLLYQHGLGVERNLQQAIGYLKQAAEAGSVDAMNALGLLFLSLGEETGEQNYTDALTWFEHASKRNSMYGLFNQGRMYEQGLGVSKDQELALELYKSASELGHTGASLKLARAYSSGDLTNYNLKKALHFLKLASEQSGNSTIKRTLQRCQESQSCNELEIGELVSLLSKTE